jgi:imidazolonepropionase-like amidohydrolase
MRDPHQASWCGCSGYVGHSTQVVDGPEQVRLAIREELRQGAGFIKIMGSGGVASPADPLERCQFSDEEISAAVDETRRQGSYVTAHVHPDEAIRRCIELGVPCLEHVTLISDSTAALAAERDVSVVPTMAVINALARHGRELGFPSVSLDKLAMLEPLALRSLERLHQAGVRTGFGTDLLGALERYQCTEFAIRGEVWAPADVLRSATSVNAEILGIGDRVGKVAPGYDADLIAVSGNPLVDLNLFTDDGRNVPLVIKKGGIAKNEL